MAQNEFEKKVQNMMKDFKITPSELVWEKLEKEIKPTKRRRFVLWIMPAIMVMVVLGGYMFFHKQEGFTSAYPEN